MYHCNSPLFGKVLPLSGAQGNFASHVPVVPLCRERLLKSSEKVCVRAERSRLRENWLACRSAAVLLAKTRLSPPPRSSLRLAPCCVTCCITWSNEVNPYLLRRTTSSLPKSVIRSLPLPR